MLIHFSQREKNRAKRKIKRNSRKKFIFFRRFRTTKQKPSGFFGWLLFRLANKLAFIKIIFFFFLVFFVSFLGVNYGELVKWVRGENNKNLSTINFYPTLQTVAEKSAYDQGWWQGEKVLGPAQYGPQQGIIDFSDQKAAFYSGGNYSLIVSGFSVLADDYLKETAASSSSENNFIPQTPAKNKTEEKDDLSDSIIDYATTSDLIASGTYENIVIKEKDNNKTGRIIDDNIDLLETTTTLNTGVIITEKKSTATVDFVDKKYDKNKRKDNIIIATSSVNKVKTENIEKEKDNNNKGKLISIINNLFNFKKQVYAEQFLAEKIDGPESLGKFKKAKIFYSLAGGYILSSNNSQSIILASTSKSNLNIDLLKSTSTDNIESVASGTLNKLNNILGQEGNELIATPTKSGMVEVWKGDSNNQKIETVFSEREKTDQNVATTSEPGPLSRLFGIDIAQAATWKERAVINVWYSLDETNGSGTELWHKLSEIKGKKFSNALNGGYFSVVAPFLRDWHDVKRLKVKFQGLWQGEEKFVAYLDSVWVEVKYLPQKDILKINKRPWWQSSLTLLSPQTVFNINEDIFLDFHYTKNKEKFWDDLQKIVGLGNYWRNVDIQVELLDSRGKKINSKIIITLKEDGKFSITLPGDKHALRPGKYTLIFNIVDKSGDAEERFVLRQNFYRGVIAFNTDKDVYHSGEKARLQLGVLDNNGQTVCDSAIEIKIITPDNKEDILSLANKKINKSPSCLPKNVTTEPDYWADYLLSQEGVYTFFIKVNTEGEDKIIKRQIVVDNNSEFFIKRRSATRINPKADYEMMIVVSGKRDFRGIIEEVVPAKFKIKNVSLKFLNQSNSDPFGARYLFTEKTVGEEKKLIWQDVRVASTSQLVIVYSFDAPNISPELFLLGSLRVGNYLEKREWQIASDAVSKRARTVVFSAGTYSGGATAGQSTNANNVFTAFNFRLAETGVDIKNAFLVFESHFEAYNVNGGDYTGYNIAFDACEESCTADAFTGSGRVLKDDNTILAYSEAESNFGRLIVDVTDEAQLAAYTGGGTQMEAQVGYRLESDNTVNSIGNAKALLVLTYTYDNDTENFTNTVIYPLDSTATTSSPVDSGTKQDELVGDCTKDLNCPLFAYKMEIPEWSGMATSTNRLSQWFTMYMVNDLHGTNDVDVTVNIEGTDVDSDNFHHESSDGSTQANIPAMVFSSVSGFNENSLQELEFVPYSPAANNDFDSIGGEVFETYIASSSATVKTRTVSFPIGVVNNGQTTNETFASAKVYFPENGTATGTVNIKKAWLRIIANNYNSGTYNTDVKTKVGDNATSSVYNYQYDPGALVPKTSFNIIHIIPEDDYGTMEEANATNSVEIILSTQNNSTIPGGLSAELMITYTYSSEAYGYLTNLQLFAGQTNVNPATNTDATTSLTVFPEISGKIMRGASLLTSYLNSDSIGDVAVGAIYNIDANLSSTTPNCSPDFLVEPDNINTFSEFYKDVTDNLGTTDSQVYNVCLVSDNTASSTDGAKASSILNYTYQWNNSPPIGSFVLASTTQKTNGSGVVDIGISVDDPDDNDLRARIQYATGTTCNFSSSGRALISENDADIFAQHGDPDVDNSLTYQIGSPSAYILTSSGTNSVFIDWRAKSDLSMVEGSYCLRLVVNDMVLDQTKAATTTVYVDTLPPSSPGDLSLSIRTGATTTLIFGATTTETNFKEYKIFYKVYDGTDPTENDSVWSSSSDANLGDQLFNGATTTSIGGLTPKTIYSFAIWAYDLFGNTASSSRVDIQTNDPPTGFFNVAAQKTNGSGRVDVSIEVDDLNNDDTNKAKIEYVSGSDCNFSLSFDPLLDTANVTADFGLPVIDNNSIYQVGSSSGYILTSPGANTVDFDWLSKSDIPAADGVYCLRLTVNDGMDDQTILATTSLTIDNVNPVSTGNLTNGGVTTDSITLIYATSSPGSDTNEPTINAYRIYYKQGTSSVSEADIEYDSTDLNNYNYNFATSAVITGLNSNTWYVINIWTYDAFGNKSAATEIAVRTNATIANDSLTFVNPQTKDTDSNIAIAGIANTWIFRAQVSETNGWYAIASTTLRLADKNDDSNPFSDLVFYWDQSTDSFFESGADTSGAVELSQTSTSTCSGNTCILDFKIIINKSFASTSKSYSAALTSVNDSGTIDTDTYLNFYQVRFPYIKQTHYRWRNDDGGE